jgi:hypothetical protein
VVAILVGIGVLVLSLLVYPSPLWTNYVVLLTFCEIVGSIKIVATSIPTITHVTTTQHWHSVPDGAVDLSIHVHLLHPTNVPTKYDLTVHFEDQIIFSKSFPSLPEKDKPTPKKGVVSLTHQITAPKLWWPNGIGAQALCDLRVVMSTGVVKTASSDKSVWEGKVGLRHLELDTSKDVSFTCFIFVMSLTFKYYFLLVWL